MFRLLVANRAHATLAALRRGGWAQAAVIAAFLGIGGAMFAGLFFFFLRAFRFIGADAVLGTLMTRYVLDAAFAVSMLLTIASVIAAAPSFFFRGAELHTLFALPIPATRVFAYRFTVVCIAASWSVLLIAVPAVAALVAATNASFAALLIGALAVVAFALASAMVGVLCAFALAPFTRRLPSPAVWVMQVVAFFGIAIWFAKRIAPRSLIVLFERAAEPAGAVEAERRITAMFQGFPSAPFTRVLTDVLDGEVIAAVIRLAMIGVVLVVAGLVLHGVARRWYADLWHLHGERRFIARTASESGASPRRRAPFPRVFRFGHGFLLEKDLLLLVRDGGEMARIASLGALLAFLVTALRAITSMSAVGNPRLFAFALTFAFAAVGYLALTFCMRFAFPAFSLEGRGAWAILSSPVHAHEIYSWKLFFWTTLVALLSVPAVAVIAALFGLPSALGAFLTFSMCCVAVTITAMALGQGTLYPHFRERNPDLIATTPSGLAATAIGLAYLAIVSRYVHMATVDMLTISAVPIQHAFGVLVVSIALSGAYWFLAVRRVDTIEVIA